jgi:glycerol-3-phosphate acyltransferase PlsY
VESVFALALALGYLLGSVPFGLILTRLGGAGDVRAIGSGSTGATNVLRTGRKGLAAATMLLDLTKGVAAVLLAGIFWPGVEIAAGAAAFGAIVGHCFPVWIGFRGGKGVATAAGASLALAWPVMLVCAGVWAATLALSRISSLASLAAIGAAPLVALLFGLNTIAAVLAAIAALVVVQHRGNIARLRAGTEAKVGQHG